MLAFDYYRKAKYEIVFLKAKTYYDSKALTRITFLVIDDIDSKQMVYLRANKDDEILTQTLLIKDSKGYIRIIRDSDIGNKTDYHDLDYYKNELGNGNTTAFDEFLEKQIIEQDNE